MTAPDFDIFGELTADECPWCGGCCAFMGYRNGEWGESPCDRCNGTGKREVGHVE